MSLYQSKNIDEFDRIFTSLHHSSIKNLLYSYVHDESKALFLLVGSIPEGNASEVSDIDIICVTNYDNIIFDNKDNAVFNGFYSFDNDPLAFFNKIIFYNDVEFDILFVSADKLMRILGRLDNSKCNFTVQELHVLSRIFNGWAFCETNINKILNIIKENGKLKLFCVLRNLIGALKHMEDAIIHKDRNLKLSKYLTNYALVEFIQCIYSSFDIYDCGHKWLRGFDKLEIDTDIKKIFYTLYFNESKIYGEKYDGLVKYFINLIINYLNKDPVFKMAIKSNSQLIKYRYIYEY
ncbi:MULTISPECIES: hypothetical protein [unclassified Acinetobacter]|uniref:hypothetical protein n=1 Tax=unclassified Acinetobacter TaxID=196816 RepID=UPI0029340E29|nr:MULTISPECIES: hypothetical protein [unclassified Acinetobacter]WOE33295.1 hypothetical protein QSG84_15460 [Acinetobacter sp. SAAs470]WOE36927.1 hypothetical protein QSG86_00705 [Acinetobacter sp. SAAs474]